MRRTQEASKFGIEELTKYHAQFAAASGVAREEVDALFDVIAKHARSANIDLPTAIRTAELALGGLVNKLEDLPKVLSGLKAILPPDMEEDFLRFLQRINPELAKFGQRTKEDQLAWAAAYKESLQLYGGERLGAMRASHALMELEAKAMDPFSPLGVRERRMIGQMREQQRLTGRGGTGPEIGMAVAEDMAARGAFERDITGGFSVRALQKQQMYQITEIATLLEQQVTTHKAMLADLEKGRQAAAGAGKDAADNAE